MKRGILTFAGLILCLACQDSVIGPEESIIGSWRANQGTETITWTFQNSGTLRVASETATGGLSFFNTRFSFSGETMAIQAFAGNDDKGNPVSFAAATCTAEVTDRSLRLVCDTGTATFTRVGPGSGENAP